MTPPFGREPYQSYRMYQYMCEYKRPTPEVRARGRAGEGRDARRRLAAARLRARRGATSTANGSRAGARATRLTASVARRRPRRAAIARAHTPEPVLGCALARLVPPRRRMACAVLACTCATRGGQLLHSARCMLLTRACAWPDVALVLPAPSSVNLLCPLLKGPPLTLGVWLPPGFDPADAPTRARPVVLFVHGGAWRAGSVNSIYAYRFLNGGSNGVIELIQNTTEPEDAPVIVGVTYRLTSAGGIYGDENVTWPAQLEDVFDAMRWLWGHADRLGIDPSRMACFGESSGAHICAHAAIRGVDERETQLVGAMLHMPPLSFYQPLIVRTEGSGSPVVLEPVCCCPPENATDTCGSCEHVSGTPYEGLAHCGYGGAYDSRHWTQPGEEYQDLVSSLPVQGLLGDSPLAVVAHQADPDPEWRAKFARFLDLDPLAAHFSGERPVPSFFTIHGTEDVTADYEYGGPRLHAALEELPDADRRVDKLVSIKGMSHSPTNEQLPLLADKIRTGFEWLRERLAPSAPSENTETGKKKKAKKKKAKKAKKKKAKAKAKKDKMKCEAAKTQTKCQKVKASCIFKKKRCRLE